MCGCGGAASRREAERQKRLTDVAACAVCRWNTDPREAAGVCRVDPMARPVVGLAVAGLCPIGRHASIEPRRNGAGEAVLTVDGQPVYDVVVRRWVLGSVLGSVIGWQIRWQIRWLGLPMPERVIGWLMVPGFGRPWGNGEKASRLPGCGCVLVLKRAWVRVWALCARAVRGGERQAGGAL
ncbi:MAG: hypothetical protein AAFR96_09380 [Planctomycetota bacterium]